MIKATMPATELPACLVPAAPLFAVADEDEDDVVEVASESRLNQMFARKNRGGKCT